MVERLFISNSLIFIYFIMAINIEPINTKNNTIILNNIYNFKRMTQSSDISNNDSNTKPLKYMYEINDIICNDKICDRGVCISSSTCLCENGYVHFIEKYKNNDNIETEKIVEEVSNTQTTSNEDPLCNYKLKRQVSSFLLELFIPLGAGHFYADRDFFGGFKFFLAIMICVFCCIVISNKESKKLRIFFTIALGLLTIGFFTWHIFDLVMFALNKYNDGNDIPLNSW